MRRIVFTILILVASLFATTINVPADHVTIQAGIDAAVDGDTILVSAGTYPDPLEAINKSIVLKSIDGPTATFITAADPFYVHNSNSLISGFTFQDNWRGIQVGDGGSTILENLIFKNIDQEALIVRGSSNVEARNLLIDNARFGVVVMNSFSSFLNCTVTNCSDMGFYIRDTSGTFIANSIIWGNGSDIWSGTNNSQDSVTISNSITQYPWLGPGSLNTEEDPLFVNVQTDDFTLTTASPAIGFGLDSLYYHGRWYYAPSEDLTRVNRPSPINSYPDIGAFESMESEPIYFPGIITVPGNHETIQAGIDAAVDGDTVLVQPGTYVENISFNGKNIVIGSLFLITQDTSYISQTVIDGNQTGSVLQILNGGDATTIIIGFTIQNGTGTNDEAYAPWIGGGGIFTKEANINIDNCRITNCSENYRYGGGILFYPSSKSLNLANSMIDNCSSSDAGGGLALFDSGSFTVTNSRIETCYAGFAGGAMYSNGELHTKNVQFIGNHANSLGGAFNSDGGDSYFEHCLFSENLSGNGGGAINFGHTANVTLNSCTLVDNDGTTRGGAIIKSQNGVLSVINSILQNNSDQYLTQVWLDAGASLGDISIEYSNIQTDTIAVYHDGGLEYTLSSTNTDIASNFVDGAVQDYRLLASSFCINAGHPDSTDSDGTKADMGAYPYLNSYTGPDRHVSVDGDDISGSGSTSNPFASIQAGINFASGSDSILVGPGTYSGTANFLGKDIDVVGVAGRDETIIDGAGAFNIFTFANGETRNAVLDGFTIQNGSSDWSAYHTEGAIYISSSSPTIKNCIIQDCEQYYYGAAIGIWNNSSPLMDNLIIRNNLSYHGGAIAVLSGNPILRNSLLYGNHSTGTAGAIYSDLNDQILRIENCTVASNTADGLYDEFWGGGVFAWNNETVEIINSIFWSNSPNQIQGYDSTSVPTTYSNIDGGFEGVGNLDIAPLFVNSEAHDYRLKATSFSINAGHPDSTDSDGTRADMGAYPYLNSYSGPIWTVSVDGDDVAGTGALSNPFGSIQAGINFSIDHDSVLVGAGTYTENVDFRGHSVAVRGIDGAINTIVDGNASGSVFLATSEEDTTTSLQDLTIRNGTGTFVYINESNQGTYGGGVFVNNASLKLTSCKVIGNHVTYSGGGIGAYQSQYIRILDCEIAENTASQDGGGVVISHSSQAEVAESHIWNNSSHNGGGLFVYGVDGRLTGLDIHGNVATSQGGGIYQGSSSIISNSLIYNNQADYGGGVNSRGNSPVLVNNTIVNNSANSSGGGIISTDSEPSLMIVNSIIFSNSAPEGGQIHTWNDGVTDVQYSLVENWITENGTISLDPRFVSSADNDFHLSDISPALGMGLDTNIVPLLDIEGIPRPNPAGSNPDIGAYESPLAEPIVVVEVQNLNIVGAGEILHLTSHTPQITYSYYNSLEEPLGFHQIQVSSLPDFSLIDKWDTYTVINPDTIVTYGGNPLIDGETYYLRVKAGSGDIWTDWTTISFRMNSIPQPPDLVSPIENSIIVEDQTFTVENSLDAETDEVLYQFFIFEDVAMTVLVDSSELMVEGVEQTIWLSEAELLDNNQYWWTSRVNDGYEYSSLSAPASFLVNTENAAPETFELLFPTPEIVISSMTPTFSWNSSLDVDPEDVVSYSFHLDTPEPGVLIYELGSDTLFLAPEPLLDNTIYYWRVVAKDLLGFETENDGGYRPFVVNVSNDHPSVVDLVTPDSVMVLSLTPEMFWTRATDVDPGDMVTYEIHWWGDGIEYDSVLTDTNAVTIPRELQDNMQYFWEVIAMDQTDGISHSEPATFWTDLVPEAPEGFALLSPENDATGLSDMPSFQWEVAEDPDPMDYAMYTMQIASDSSFSEVVFETNTNVETGLELTESLPTDTEYWWRVLAIDTDSLTTASETFTFTVGYVSIADDIALPTEYMLDQNYPNPFNPSTTIRYGLPEESNVSLVIYDVRGQVVQTLESGHQTAGWYDVVWNGQTASGKTISTGIYFARMVAGDYRQVVKMLYLK